MPLTDFKRKFRKYFNQTNHFINSHVIDLSSNGIHVLLPAKIAVKLYNTVPKPLKLSKMG